MADLSAPFMVERGHLDGVGVDEMVAYEYAKTDAATTCSALATAARSNTSTAPRNPLRRDVRVSPQAAALAGAIEIRTAAVKAGTRHHFALDSPEIFERVRHMPSAEKEAAPLDFVVFLGRLTKKKRWYSLSSRTTERRDIGTPTRHHGVYQPRRELADGQRGGESYFEGRLKRRENLMRSAGLRNTRHPPRQVMISAAAFTGAYDEKSGSCRALVAVVLAPLLQCGCGEITPPSPEVKTEKTSRIESIRKAAEQGMPRHNASLDKPTMMAKAFRRITPSRRNGIAWRRAGR